MTDISLMDEMIKALGMAIAETYGDKAQFDVIMLIPEENESIGLSVAGHTCAEHLPKHLRACADHMEKAHIKPVKEALQ